MMQKKLVSMVMLVAMLLALLPAAAQAAPVTEEGARYTVQAGDTLSTIAEKQFGDSMTYVAILYYNNQMAREDKTLTFIANPETLEAGWVIYLPSAAEVKAYLDKVGKGVTLPEVDPLTVTGNIVSAGSSTVFPLSERMAERFKDEGYQGNITIDSIGTGGGFERFCKMGETDISNASRAIKDAEMENCQAIGREPIEFRIGTDALAVVASSENTFLTNVTIDNLAKIFSSETQKWSDVNPAWPSEDIKRFSPGTDSGTFDYFVEAVMDKSYGTGKGEEYILKAANLQLSEDDNVLVQGVEGSPYAIGYFGYAYYLENKSRLHTLNIEGIAPADQTVDAGLYPLARPLFLYTTGKIMNEKPQVSAFINFYLTNVNEEIKSVGYFPLSADLINQAREMWLEAMAQ